VAGKELHGGKLNCVGLALVNAIISHKIGLSLMCQHNFRALFEKRNNGHSMNVMWE